MGDPLSAISGIVGVLGFGIQVGEVLYKYYNAYKDQNRDVKHTIDKLENLVGTMKHLTEALQTRQTRFGDTESAKQISMSIWSCTDLIDELEEECNKIQKPASQGIKGSLQHAGRRIAYPFKASTLKKLEENVDDIQASLALAVNVLQLQDHQKTYDSMAATQNLVMVVAASQLDSEVRQRLRAPDALINHNSACTKRHDGTGLWFVEGPQFIQWLHTPNSFLWTYGFAGCGKSVLCSTAIQCASRETLKNSRVGIAFFYFTFNDIDKQDTSAMLRCLLQQLSCQSPGGSDDLVKLFRLYQTGTPPNDALLTYLKRLILKLEQVYIFLDALDEVPRGSPRNALLDAIDVIRSWSIQGLHLLVTSRDDVDIRDKLQTHSPVQVVMKNTGIDGDINSYIASRLRVDVKLAKWKDDHDTIQDALAHKAQGVFRWVECQLESIKRCPRSKKRLEQCLQSLPQDLDETYERILCSIDQDSFRDALRLLTVLCYAMGPLSVSQVFDAIAVDLEEPACFDRDLRFKDVDSLREICPGLVEIYVPEYAEDLEFDDHDFLLVRIAHFSVQEYLESSRIKEQKAHKFALHNTIGHAEMTKICLTYLMDPSWSDRIMTDEMLDDLPLCYYAARRWWEHYSEAEEVRHTPQVRECLTKLFTSKSESFRNWVRLHDVEYYQRCELELPAASIAQPLYYACWLSETWLFEEISCDQTVDMNAHGGLCENALQVASQRDNEQIVLQLITHGAKVNHQGGAFKNAVIAAAYSGRLNILRILLDNGANLSTYGGSGMFGSPLRAAIAGNHDHVVRLLIDRGIDVNGEHELRASSMPTPLQLASYYGYDKVVTVLLECGADINVGLRTEGEAIYETALQMASREGYKQIVRLLIDHGAELEARDGHDRTALHLASLIGHEEVVAMLLDVGADVNAESNLHGTAFRQALQRGHAPVLRLLLQRGADVEVASLNAALLWASFYGDEALVQDLINHGADINAELREYEHGAALHASAQNGHEHVVRLLLDNGAHVNAGTWEVNNTALHLASEGGYEQIIQLLLDRGANINARRRLSRETALIQAAYDGQESIVRLLLIRGADVNVQDEYGNALHVASEKGHIAVVRLLIDHGADVNAQDESRSSTALHWASERGDEQIAQLLLDRGANVNVRDSFGSTSLVRAAYYGRTQIIDLLLDNGASMKIEGKMRFEGDSGTALDWAVATGQDNVLRQLMLRMIE